MRTTTLFSARWRRLVLVLLALALSGLSALGADEAAARSSGNVNGTIDGGSGGRTRDRSGGAAVAPATTPTLATGNEHLHFE